METDYNFWADLLTTYRSNPDWLKFLWVFLPAALLALAGSGVSRLVRAVVEAKGAASPSPPPSPPKAFRSWHDEHGFLYMEALDELPAAAAAAAPPPLPWEGEEGDGASGDGDIR
ncbi:MAG: hypothetical protein ABJM29_09170 [Rhizobiaceae bacterium]